ncbi:hypothetical protein V5O48_009657 [Marasmius crinis-equi]|uniref:Uncharacterized protein n=1 Tax=Marasmius crinis-equi TaxID=585013 RepID=A0ABR3FB26_9AGAR
MPRPRKYKTEDEQRVAARERSKRYYQKNAQEIKDKKKNKRMYVRSPIFDKYEPFRSYSSRGDDIRLWMRPKEPEVEAKYDSDVQWDDWDPKDCLPRVRALIEHEFRRAGSSGFRYMKTLYRTASIYLLTDCSLNTPDFPVWNVKARFQYFYLQAVYQRERAEQWYGCGSEVYLEAEELLERVLYLMSCVDDLMLAASRNRFHREYKKRRYLFQQEWMYRYLVDIRALSS